MRLDSKIRDGRGRGDLTMCYTEMAAMFASSERWLRCSGLGLQLRSDFVAEYSLFWWRGKRGRKRKWRGRPRRWERRRGDEEVSICCCSHIGTKEGEGGNLEAAAMGKEKERMECFCCSGACVRRGENMAGCMSACY
jgi:hypothetical protein